MVLSWNLAFFCFIERSPLSSKGEKYSSTPAGGIGGGERGWGGGGRGGEGRGQPIHGQMTQKYGVNPPM
jgi:hypothetical protein